MEKSIPIYFDAAVIDPIQEISETNPNISRLKVRVFTKYGNRNGSYITDEVAQQLVQSATQGNIPVVGFFDPSTEQWAGHTGPTLANGYGYVEDFLGWEPFTDTDGVTRDYAVFSVILFTNYFEEAKKVLGQNQSMELDVSSIQGDCISIDDEEYFVYTSAKILGLCIIGSREPCFSVSAFFEKSDEVQYDKFSALLNDLRALVEKTQFKLQGGTPMEDNMEQQVNEVEVEETVTETPEEPVEGGTPAANTEEVSEFEEVAAGASEEVTEPVEEVSGEEETPATDFETLYNDEVAARAADKANFENIIEEMKANAEKFELNITELQNSVTSLQTENASLKEQLAQYAAMAVAQEQEKKADLIKKYESLIHSQNEFDTLKADMNNISYEELESKLAIIFANEHLQSDTFEQKVPLQEPPESQFALLMKQYKRK